MSNSDLQQEYGNKVLTLRHFYPGQHLHFDSAGKPANPASPGAWTVDGMMRVQDISVNEGVVHIRAQRMFLFIDPETKHLRDTGSITKKDPANRLFREKELDQWTAKNGQTEIEVECGTAEPEMADLRKAMTAVFLAPEESLTDVVPEFWLWWVANGGNEGNQDIRYHDDSTARVGKGGVSAPRVTHQPDPVYSTRARAAGYQGTVVLWMIVNEAGLPESIKVVRPLGMGLDEQAVEAVQAWKFRPAMKGRDPVAVQINVEVQFRLY